MNPLMSFIFALGKTLYGCLSLSLLMAFVAAVAYWLYSKLSKEDEEKPSSIKPVLILILIQMFIYSIYVFPLHYDAYSSPVSSYDKVAERYQEEYPSTWAYISKYSDDPYDYVVYYDIIWGDLQKYHGDGIFFDTLSKYEQSLVDYPTVDEYICRVQGSNTYHSTASCYTLLRSDVITLSSKYSYLYEPCSKCVGE